MPCVYLPGPAPAVTVANIYSIFVEPQYNCFNFLLYLSSIKYLLLNVNEFTPYLLIDGHLYIGFFLFVYCVFFKIQ